MTNPFEAIDHKLDEIRATIKRDVQMAILREDCFLAVSRMITLCGDDAKAAQYKAVFDTLNNIG